MQPYVALGCGLRDAGHRVTICTSNRFAPWIRDHNLDVSDFNDDFMELVDSQEAKEAMEGDKNPVLVFTRLRRLMKKASGAQRSMMIDGWKAALAFNPDVILFHPKAYGGAHFAEKLNISAAMAVVF